MALATIEIGLNVSVWYDGEKFNAQLFWDDVCTDEKVLSATDEDTLATQIADKLRQYVRQEVAVNLFPGL